MGAGGAIVASRVGQIGEVLADEQTALPVEPDEPRALTDAIVRLVSDPVFREQLGDAARAAAEREHSWSRNADRLIRSLISEGGSTDQSDRAHYTGKHDRHTA